MPAAATRTQAPFTDHLWSLGFRLEFEVRALPTPLVFEDTTHGSTVYNSQTKLTAYPERGEARRLFAGKGPAAATAYSNYAAQMFEQEGLGSQLEAAYTESNARTLFEMLSEVAPTISRPGQTAASQFRREVRESGAEEAQGD